jgi:hypothetical protein
VGLPAACLSTSTIINQPNILGFNPSVRSPGFSASFSSETGKISPFLKGLQTDRYQTNKIASHHL